MPKAATLPPPFSPLPSPERKKKYLRNSREGIGRARNAPMKLPPKKRRNKKNATRRLRTAANRGGGGRAEGHARPLISRASSSVRADSHEGVGITRARENSRAEVRERRGETARAREKESLLGSFSRCAHARLTTCFSCSPGPRAAPIVFSGITRPPAPSPRTGM